MVPDFNCVEYLNMLKRVEYYTPQDTPIRIDSTRVIV